MSRIFLGRNFDHLSFWNYNTGVGRLLKFACNKNSAHFTLHSYICGYKRAQDWFFYIYLNQQSTKYSIS